MEDRLAKIYDLISFMSANMPQLLALKSQSFAVRLMMVPSFW